jgi:hypothetical protein
MHRRYPNIIVTTFLIAAIAICAGSCGEETPQGPDGDDGGNGDTPVDTIPPAVVDGILLKVPTSSTLTLQWFSPGDDGDVGQADEYDIRWATSEITELNWDSANRVPGVPAPKPADQAEQFTVRNLPSSTEVHFAMKTYDEVPNASELSESVSDTTRREHLVPARVEDLLAIGLNATDYILTWTASGDDGVGGTASYYDVRYSVNTITTQNWGSAAQMTGEPAPLPSGEPESLLVTIPDPTENYHFALKVGDEVPNWSEMSNVSRGFAYDEYILAYPRDVQIGETENVQIFFRLVDPGDAAITISWLDYSVYPWEITVLKHVVRDDFPAGPNHVTWDLTNDNGVPVNPTIAEQAYVRLHIGAALVDSVQIRLLPDPDN